MNVRSKLSVGVATAAVIASGAAGGVAASGATRLTGSGHGTWTAHRANPDTGTQYALTGHGHFSIGNATIRGQVSAPGFIANGDCSVSISLKAATGSIGIVGHSKRVSPPPSCNGPFSFRWHSVKASGDQTGLSYQGVGRLNLASTSSSSADTGTFTLKLTS